MHLSKSRLENMSLRDRWAYLTRGCDQKKLKRFQEFHEANTYVYDMLEKEAEEQLASGWWRSSVWLILNTIRWGPGSTVDTATSFKISNDYFAFYARLLIARQPKFANWIEVKAMRGQESDYGEYAFQARGRE